MQEHRKQRSSSAAVSSDPFCTMLSYGHAIKMEDEPKDPPECVTSTRDIVINR
jgi:hypothetical protein